MPKISATMAVKVHKSVLTLVGCHLLFCDCCLLLKLFFLQLTFPLLLFLCIVSNRSHPRRTHYNMGCGGSSRFSRFHYSPTIILTFHLFALQKKILSFRKADLTHRRRSLARMSQRPRSLRQLRRALLPLQPPVRQLLQLPAKLRLLPLPPPLLPPPQEWPNRRRSLSQSWQVLFPQRSRSRQIWWPPHTPSPPLAQRWAPRWAGRTLEAAR